MQLRISEFVLTSQNVRALIALLIAFGSPYHSRPEWEHLTD